MIKHALLAAAATLMLPLGSAYADDGCDGGCRPGHRGWDRSHRYDRDRYYGRHYNRQRTVVSFNYGWAPRAYSYPYYYPTRVVYAPAPAVVQPQVVYINDQNSREVSYNDGRYCREYQAVSRIGGVPKQTYGTACMQPDGSWEIVS